MIHRNLKRIMLKFQIKEIFSEKMLRRSVLFCGKDEIMRMNFKFIFVSLLLAYFGDLWTVLAQILNECVVSFFVFFLYCD